MKCECGRSMVNVSADPGQSEWECRYTRCLLSIHHLHNRCDTCGSPPAELTAIGCGYSSYLCQNGHEFTIEAGAHQRG